MMGFNTEEGPAYTPPPKSGMSIWWQQAYYNNLIALTTKEKGNRMIRNICRIILGIVCMLYHLITIPIGILLAPILLIVVFSSKDSTWKDYWEFLSQFMFLGSHIMKDIWED